MKIRLLILFILLPLVSYTKDRLTYNALQKSIIVHQPLNTEVQLGEVADVLNEQGAELQYTDVIAGRYDSMFSKQYRFDNTNRQSFWVKINLKSTSDRQISWILKASKRYSYADAFILYPGGRREIQRSGREIAPAERSNPDPHTVFKFTTYGKEGLSIYLHINTSLQWSSLHKIDLTLQSESHWYASKLRIYSFLFAYAGICLLAIFYWLISYLHSGQKNYLFLIAATFSALVFCLDIYGVTALLWDTYPMYSVAKYGEQMVWIPFMVTSYFFIAYETNPFPDYFSDTVIRVYWLSCIIAVLLLVGCPFFLTWKYARIISLSWVVLCIIGGSVLINILLFNKGYKAAAFGFLAILPIMIGVTGYILTVLEILPQHFDIMAPIGGLCTTIMFFYGMIIYVRILRQKRKKESREKEQLILEQNTVLAQKIEERTNELNAAQAELIIAEKKKENEIIRSRISQDIHDDVSSELTRITWISELAKANTVKGELSDVPGMLDKINASSRETVSKLGEIIWAINPNFDTLGSLLSYIRNYVSKFLVDTQIQYSIQFPDTADDMLVSPELKRNIFLIVKESLNNTIKYAKATSISVSFNTDGLVYTMSISDNGVGIQDGVIHGSGNGLRNMQSRMKQMHGNFEIKSTPGNGTNIILSGHIY